MAKLGEICAFQSGGTPSKNKPEYFGGEIPWISTTALNGGKINETDAVAWITPKAIRESAAKIVPANSIMIGTRVGIGKVAINTVEMSTSQDVISLINIDEDKWYKPYLCKLLLSKKDYFNSQARGATIKGIKIDVVANIDVPEIDYATQRKVAATLNKIDTLIVLRKQQLAKLDELVKARFVEMFGTYPKNENGFPVAVISDVANVSVGVVIKPAQYYVTEKCGIKAFRSLNIGEMYIKDSDWVYFSTEGNESNKKSQLHENDLLIVRSGAPGTSCVVTKEFEGCNAVDVIIAHPNLSKVNPWYLCAYINYPHGKKQIEERTGGAAQQHFNVGKCNNLKVLLPPLEPQNQFAAFAERVNQQKQTVQQSLEKLELMKKALMQEYFG